MMRSIRGLALAAAVLAGSGAAAQPAPPPPASAPDGLRVTLCGTSGPLPVRDRAKACVAVQAGSALYLVDIGPEAAENLQTWRLPDHQARAVFLTHLHSDHIGDLGQFNMQSWVAGGPEPLVVVGPPGVEDVTAGFDRAYAADRRYRNAHHEHGDVRLPVAAGRLVSRMSASAPPAPRPPGGRAD